MNVGDSAMSANSLGDYGDSMQATARCGGHVTLLFSIHSESEDPLQQGSRGAGFCVEAGVECTIQAIPLSEGEEFSVNIGIQTTDGPIDDETVALLYVDVIEEFMQRKLLDENLCYHIDVTLELPLSQGFGMSAAGALSCAKALCSLLELETEPTQIAHIIERKNSSGLGDVLAATVGGIELRTQPGAPLSSGRATSFSSEVEVLLCWDPDFKRHTRTYIDDPQWKVAISEAGEESVSRLSVGDWNSSRWQQLLDEAERFGESAGLVDELGRSTLIERVKKQIPSSHRVLPCMLGTSVCILPENLSTPLANLEEVLLASSIECLRTRIN